MKEFDLKKKIKEEKMDVENNEEFNPKKDGKLQISQNGKKKKKKRISIDEAVGMSEESEDLKKGKKKRQGSGTESDRSDSVSNTPKVDKEQKEGRKRKGKHLENMNTSETNDKFNDSSASECDKICKEDKDESFELGAKSSEMQEVETQSEKEKESQFAEETCSVPKKRKTADTNEENTNQAKENEFCGEPMEESQLPKEREEKKKKRKRKRSRRHEEIEAPDTGLEIMAKKEWKRLRNKYLEMQRAKMKQLKQHLKRGSWNQWQNTEKIKAEKEELNDKDFVKEEKPSRINFTPGVIVKIEMDSPCSDPKNFKVCYLNYIYYILTTEDKSIFSESICVYIFL